MSVGIVTPREAGRSGHVLLVAVGRGARCCQQKGQSHLQKHSLSQEMGKHREDNGIVSKIHPGTTPTIAASREVLIPRFPVSCSRNLCSSSPRPEQKNHCLENLQIYFI